MPRKGGGEGGAAHGRAHKESHRPVPQVAVVNVDFCFVAGSRLANTKQFYDCAATPLQTITQRHAKVRTHNRESLGDFAALPWELILSVLESVPPLDLLRSVASVNSLWLSAVEEEEEMWLRVGRNFPGALAPPMHLGLPEPTTAQEWKQAFRRLCRLSSFAEFVWTVYDRSAFLKCGLRVALDDRMVVGAGLVDVDLLACHKELSTLRMWSKCVRCFGRKRHRPKHRFGGKMFSLRGEAMIIEGSDCALGAEFGPPAVFPSHVEFAEKLCEAMSQAVLIHRALLAMGVKTVGEEVTKWDNPWNKVEYHSERMEDFVRILKAGRAVRKNFPVWWAERGLPRGYHGIG